MKGMKQAAGVLLAMTLLLTGCGSSGLSQQEQQQAASSLSGAFSAKAVMRMGNLEAEADLNRTENGVCTFAMTRPKSLSGLTFSFDAETITVDYLGLQLELDSDSVFTSAMAKAIITSINAAAEPHGVSMQLEPEALLVKGTTESGDFILRLDRSDYSMLTLSIPNLELECQFDPFYNTK